MTATTGTERKRHTFIAALVERLPVPNKGRAAYFDAKTRGLCLRVTPDGVRVFYVVRVVPATRKRVWVKLGDASTPAFEGARRAAEKAAGSTRVQSEAGLSARAGFRLSPEPSAGRGRDHARAEPC
jgi:hypothetical protein